MDNIDDMFNFLRSVWNVLTYTGWFTIVAEISTANIVLDMQWGQLLRKEELNNEK